ncbi:MAG TPA: hypothetical protein PKK94_12060 [Leptospiraceae bacterium]|nr:hypothetical protein [Leptospiraceae bacterium]
MKEITLKNKIISVLMVSLIACTGLFSNGKEKQKTAVKPDRQKKSYSIFDDGMERKILLEPDLLAEFGAASSGKTHSRSSEPQSSKGGVKIWNISGSSLSRNLSDGKMTDLSGETSPVFSENGRLLAFPGGVLVTLKNGKSCQSWAAGKNLRLGEQSAIPNLCNIITVSGNASLETANSLRMDPDVKSAVPNLWMESDTR